MSYFLKLILSLSLSGTLLILLLRLLRPVYRNRMSKRWQYYIWLVVIVRLLLPITPESSLVGNLLRQAEQMTDSDIAANPSEEQSLLNSDTVGDFDIAPVKEKSDSDSIDHTAGAHTSTDSSSSVSPDESHTDTASILLTAWLFIALLLFMRKITVYQSFSKYVRAGSRPIDDINLLEHFGQIMAQNQIQGTIDLYSNSLVSSPLLIGFLHPRIILPDENLSGNDFYYTILHELVHYRRRDMFYKWLVQLTICLHWFNPAVYLMGREISRLCELSCDERVIESLPEADRQAYGDTLVSAAGAGGSYRDALASVTLNESKELLKGRLDAIMNYRKITKSIKTAAVFITGILIGAATVLGAYASPADRISSDPDYTIQYENGTYYVLAYGAAEADKPSSGVTNGYYKLTLVRKDSYASFGAWDDYDMQSLVRHITEQCNTRLANGQLTQEDVDIVIAAATQIQQAYQSGTDNTAPGRTFAYRQTASYQSPYIIEYGYNLPSSDRDFYNSITLTPAENLSIQIYFSEEAEKFMSDDKAISAITSLVRLKLLPRFSSSQALEALLIVSMEDVGDTDINSLAEKYYKEEMLTYFHAVFAELDAETQQNYLDLAYEDEKLSFFASCINDTGVPKDVVDTYILRAYEDGRTNFFAVLSGMLDDDSRERWLEKCGKDGRTSYWHILSEDDAEENDTDNDFHDEYNTNYYDAGAYEDSGTNLQEYPDETGLLEEYNGNNIIIIKNSYFYQNSRIRLLLDERADGSFENFSYDERGTADIRLLRDQNNEIAGIEYLSTEEAAEIIQDIIDSDDSLPVARDKDYHASSTTNILDLNRITKQELPVHLQNKLNTCDSGKWYVIDTGECQYIYYNGLPHTYAYSYDPQITGSEAGDLVTVAVSDIATTTPLLQGTESVSDYVLLCFSYSPGIPGADYNLSITYNKVPVTYELMTAGQTE